MLGFYWLKALTNQAIQHSQPEPPQPVPIPQPPTLEQQILALCHQPITLGELSDRTGLTYHQLSPLVAHLIGQRQLRTVLCPLGSLNIIHFVIFDSHVL